MIQTVEDKKQRFMLGIGIAEGGFGACFDTAGSVDEHKPQVGYFER